MILSSPVHFYITFNPKLNNYPDSDYTQAHEFHDFLSNIIKNSPKGHAYWGKIIGHDRTAKVIYDDFKEVLEQNLNNNLSTHLYISDFNNLWVGKVEAVENKINDYENTLDFYKNKNVEVWFKITDFSLLECSSENTIQKLSELYIDNKYMNLKIDEISPFTTAVRYPIFVQDLAEEMYFDEIEDETHLILRPNPAINNTTIAHVLKSIHSFCFPEYVYKLLPYSAKIEIEASEIDMLERRGHNMHKIAFSYIKSVEIILNDLIIKNLKIKGYGDEFFVDVKSMPPKLYLHKEKTSFISLDKFNKSFSIGQLIYFVRRCHETKSFCFRKTFNDHKPFILFMINRLPKILDETSLLKIRGILAHNDSQLISVEDAMAVRNSILGVGCRGLIHAIYQSYYHKDLDKMYKIQRQYDQDTVSNKNLKVA